MADQEAEAAACVPTIMIDRFRVEATAEMVRIVFGNKAMPDAPTHFHSAIYMTVPNFRSLIDVGENCIQDQETKAAKK